MLIIKKGKKIIAKKICDCKGLMSAVGLRFKKDFGDFDAYLIHMLFDSTLDSFFVYQDFAAIWLDKDYNVLKAELCKPWKFFSAVNGQSLVLELPASKKGLVKKGDKLDFKIDV
ncbi:Uncharacterised protein [Candidatus Tiddalikarchaeum anstoanum]|nr:Uncharacterised protein [Candidatus Tiddalikarchaeum anstoanum]